MNNTFNGWSDISKLNLESVIDLVLTNGTSHTIKSDQWISPMIGDINTEMVILDFGCGVGRNIFDFSQIYSKWNFYGYDNENMLRKADEYSKIKFNKKSDQYSNVKLSDDWNVLSNMKFDCIYATIVFQHIFEIPLNEYLKNIKKMTHKLIVSGRRFNDDMIDGQYKNTWQILENNGYYPSNANDIGYSVDGDPHQHITCVYDF